MSTVELPALTPENERMLQEYLSNKCNKEGHPNAFGTWVLEGNSVKKTFICNTCKIHYVERKDEDFAKEMVRVAFKDRAGGQVSGIPIEYRLGNEGGKCVDRETRDAEEWFKNHAYEFFSFCEKLKVERYFRKGKN